VSYAARGLVKVDGLRVDAEAASDGARGISTGTVVWQSLTLAGQKVAVDQDDLPKLPVDLTKQLATRGLSVDVPTVDKKVDGAGARVAGHGLTITLDTGALLRRLSLAALLDPILALLPADLRTQLTPWLNLSPRFVFVLGTASSQASATPAVAAEAPPAAPPAAVPPAGGTGDSGGSGTGVSGDSPSGTWAGEAPTPVANSQGPVFPGVPWYAFVLGFAVAAAVSYGHCRYVALMFGAGGCDLGVPAGVPDLRDASKER
jgi:hypothetical protein